VSSSPILKDKNAIVFGAGGSIGAAVAKEFAAEGAEVFLAGRTKSNVEKVAKEITVGGGRAHAAAIDAMNEVAVSESSKTLRNGAAKLTLYSMPLEFQRKNTETAKALSSWQSKNLCYR